MKPLRHSGQFMLELLGVSEEAFIPLLGLSNHSTSHSWASCGPLLGTAHHSHTCPVVKHACGHLTVRQLFSLHSTCVTGACAWCWTVSMSHRSHLSISTFLFGAENQLICRLFSVCHSDRGRVCVLLVHTALRSAELQEEASSNTNNTAILPTFIYSKGCPNIG